MTKAVCQLYQEAVITLTLNKYWDPFKHLWYIRETSDIACGLHDLLHTWELPFRRTELCDKAQEESAYLLGREKPYIMDIISEDEGFEVSRPLSGSISLLFKLCMRVCLRQESNKDGS